MFESLSDPMRSLVLRLGFLAAGALVGGALYALGVGGVLAIPVGVIGFMVIGELSLLVVGDGP